MQSSLSSSVKFVAVDTETTGLGIRDGRDSLTGISIAFREGDAIEAIYLPFFHPGYNYDWIIFRDLLQRLLDMKPIIFFNAKFDLISLQTVGLKTRNCNFYDTMLLAHLVNENEPFAGYRLEFVSKFYLSDGGKKMEKGSPLWLLTKATNAPGWKYVPGALMAEYGMYDAYLTMRLFEVLWPQVVAEGTQDNWAHKRKMTWLIADMEANGVGVNIELCEEMVIRGEEEMAKITEQLGGLNAASPIDLKKLLVGQLGLPVIIQKKTGRPTFDKNAMKKYEEILSRSSNPTAQLILSYRGWQKSVSSNYKAYLDLLSPDGRLRANYLQHGTHTGRLSCEKPNLQQIPKKGTKPWNGLMKKCFVARPGYELWEADYSQLEFRLGAAYADQQNLIEIFNDPTRDVFTEMAAELGMPRQDTKTLVYTTQYGGGVNRIQEVFGVSSVRAKDIIENYFATYPGFRTISKQVEHAAKTKGKVKLWTGRYRHFQYPKDEAFKAFNSLIQGGAAEVVERAMLRCEAAGLNEGDCKMLLQVHDSVVFEIKSGMVEHYSPIILKAMSDIPEPWGVKFAVDLHPFGE